MTEQPPDEIRNEAETLIAGLEGKGTAPLTFFRVEGGANNQVFQVESREARYGLKWYFSHPDDPRDRLRHEWEFSKFAWSRGIRSIPEPLAVRAAKNLAVYRWIEGAKLTATMLDIDHIDRAVEFVCRLNQDRESAETAGLPNASEACFNRREQLVHVDRRMDRLSGISSETRIHEEAAEFVSDRLFPRWQDVRKEIAEASNSRFDAETEPALRVVSPSDFGFHNAILGRDGGLYFLDFEYAGWDSLIKLICDFFHQPEVPVSKAYLPKMLDQLAARLQVPGDLADPVRRFLPVYGIKWCCILLNEFLPAGQSRRSFSGQKPIAPEQLGAQLDKARQKLDSLFDLD